MDQSVFSELEVLLRILAYAFGLPLVLACASVSEGSLRNTKSIDHGFKLLNQKADSHGSVMTEPRLSPKRLNHFETKFALRM